VETTEPAPQAPLAFSTARTMKHIKKLASDIGIRPGGSAAEDEAVAYVWDYLATLGYQPIITEVPLPNGKTSHNVTVTKEGASPLSVVIGGHLDTKKTTPGANDDASGAAAVLELARDFADADMGYTLVFVLLGTEEIIDADKNHHHYGSRNYVANMTAEEKSNLSAMISLDMIAYGETFNVRTMGKGPQTLRDMLLSASDDSGAGLVYLKDTGPSGWSDHEPFELAGYPAVWLQWLEDPTYHGRGDTYEHCNEGVVRTTGEFLHAFLADLSPQDLELLHESVRP
jgi:Zn-dependent M28 family amino/carboxypeptidase